ncbi:helix-turn-helix transcriptional regulator [Mesorhizobium sp.]|uniref:helix-turn-helix transcriptional regulator n=1 Tax=Mesorhizobium sp. TaxID=1871066 RepID=UPI000FE35BAB|nr:helix-turn-helix transcriptional regulator [Mesorhizobium sp.]RWA62458.1 MAG: helix-turn-helix transcriptional regulator [Mesorhizobium sp.]RWB92835.1 MAG: helix-turn-helix transcriptional regulator [Mesorhizobium sp.]RWG76216.1 MAG: helix-turn-helix transcriptional regulator [Mesorhizobium sp.]RWG90860.1 MAG: helix-turn-helix transcriptional regulator [Mesorhizobium sp.]RWK04168.1 MAG: helix-turn-helix transcriptional regulator [Mesorhizobium sp.]
MGAQIDFAAISAAFSEAAIDPTRWNDAMEVALRATESAGALLFDIKGHLPNIPRSASMESSFDVYVRDGWINRDERYRLAPFLARNGVSSEFDLLRPDDIAKHPYYQEFLAPLGLRWCALVKIAAGDDFWSLSLQRTIKQGPFLPEEMQQLSELSKSLGSVTAVARALGFARAKGALDAFSTSGTAALMLDQRGEVLGVNNAAEQLMGKGLQVTGRRIASNDRNATEALDRALQALLRRPASSATMPPVPLPRSKGRPLFAYALRLSGVTWNALAPCQVIIVIVDPDECPRPPEVAFQACFGLTLAEARLARELSSGEELAIAADRLGVCYETARNRLKAIFAKTDTHRQSELVSLFSRLAKVGGHGPTG